MLQRHDVEISLLSRKSVPALRSLLGRFQLAIECVDLSRPDPNPGDWNGDVSVFSP